MDGLGLAAGQLGDPLGRPAGGGRDGHRFPHPLQQGDNRPQGGGFSGAGTAGENQRSLFNRLGYRQPLLALVPDMVAALDGVDARLDIGVGHRRETGHQPDAGRDKAFRLMKMVEEEKPPSLHLLLLNREG